MLSIEGDGNVAVEGLNVAHSLVRDLLMKSDNIAT